MTYDRYLLRNFLSVFAICFTATFGLVVVIDLFENLDEFLTRSGNGGPLQLIRTIGECYAIQSIFFLDRAGPTMIVISVMVVLVLLQRSGELHPLLAAGIPMYRVLAPLIAASAVASLTLALNQEFVVPQIAHAAFAMRGAGDSTKHQVESLIDHSTRISIDGQSIRLADRTIEQAVFVLPAPGLVNEITILESASAKFFPPKGRRPAGWFLRDVTPTPEEVAGRLTERGQKVVLSQTGSAHLFVVSAVTCDQLYKRDSSFSLLSTPELVSRIRSPAVGLVAVHRLVLHLHSRLVQPLINLLAVLIAIPLMVRRESPGLVADSALCGFVLVVLFGLTQGSQILGVNQVIPADLAAWIPVLFGGTVSAWLSGVIRT